MSSTRTICVVCLFIGYKCHNLSLGLITKTRLCKGVGQEWSPGITFHAPGGVRECEGLNPHTPKLMPTLGVEVLMDPAIFKMRFQGTKHIGSKSSLYCWKNLGMWMFKRSHVPYGYLKHKLWPKVGMGIKCQKSP
jgi:hypothetical protein